MGIPEVYTAEYRIVNELSTSLVPSLARFFARYDKIIVVAFVYSIDYYAASI